MYDAAVIALSSLAARLLPGTAFGDLLPAEGTHYASAASRSGAAAGTLTSGPRLNVAALAGTFCLSRPLTAEGQNQGP